MAETEHSIAANGLQIHYRESGHGQPLLLLHGGTATSGSWSSQLPIFAEHFRVLAPDSRGHGKTDNPSGQLSYGLMAQDVAAFIEALGLEKPLVLGYSDGGQIALELGMNYPDVAEALVVGGVSFRFGHTYYEGLRSWGFESAADVNGDTLQRVNPDWLQYLKMEHVRSDDPNHWQSLLEQISRMWFSPQTYTEEQVSAISAPTLIFLGDRDELNDVDQNVEMYRLIPDAELAIVPNANHFTAADEMSNRVVLQFLQRHTPADPATAV
jgi:pimeloyl-ACP methyl ester carboxylesterase